MAVDSDGINCANGLPISNKVVPYVKSLFALNCSLSENFVIVLLVPPASVYLIYISKYILDS